jgi:type II secretory ATPase GspE/PulE/Tfp pilus assembly ATPase PilB-like protein
MATAFATWDTAEKRVPRKGQVRDIFCSCKVRSSVCTLPIAAKKKVAKKSFCLVLNQFGTLNPSVNSVGLSNEALASQLHKDGYNVTVLYTGPATPHFESLASSYAHQYGIILTK